MLRITYTKIGVHDCFLFDTPFKSCEIQKGQKENVSKRLSICHFANYALRHKMHYKTKV